jgi:glycosyltransferase involved in cell wall biosynthesis
LLGRVHRISNILSVHGGDLYDPSKAGSPHRHAWLRAPIKYLLERADRLVGQSRNTLEHVESIYGVRRKTELIPLGIERPPEVASARAAFGLANDAFVMVTVGRVVPRKATVRLVKALEAAERPNAHLLIVGDGPDCEAVRRAAVEAHLADRVHLTGQLSEERKFQALASADVFVSASQHEGFGLVFLEAMAYRLPIICFDHGGQTDFLVSGETGFVVRLNDHDSFTRAIVQLHDSPPLAKRMGQFNANRVEDYFIDRCAQRYEAVFEEAVSGRAGAALKGEV